MADIEGVGLEPDTTYDVDDLQLWSLSTFRTTSFMITLVISQYIQGSLQERFKSLGTGIGLLLFAGLWACTWLTTRWGLRAQAALPRRPQAWGPPLVPTIVAGGWNGLLIFVPLMVTFLIRVATDGQARVLPMLVLLLVGTVIGGGVAFVVGALVGLLYGIAEAFLLGFSDRIYRWTTR